MPEIENVFSENYQIISQIDPLFNDKESIFNNGAFEQLKLQQGEDVAVGYLLALRDVCAMSNFIFSRFSEDGEIATESPYIVRKKVTVLYEGMSQFVNSERNKMTNHKLG